MITERRLQHISRYWTMWSSSHTVDTYSTIAILFKWKPQPNYNVMFRHRFNRKLKWMQKTDDEVMFQSTSEIIKNWPRKSVFCIDKCTIKLLTCFWMFPTLTSTHRFAFSRRVGLCKHTQKFGCLSVWL